MLQRQYESVAGNTGVVTFNAAVLRAASAPLEVEKLEIRNLGADDVLVRIKATSLCHTDLEAVEGQLGTPLPLVPGHEASGVVEWVGPSVTDKAVGDHVVVSWNPHCNHCFYCAKHQPILCQQYRDNAATSMHFDGKPRFFASGEPVHQLMYAGTFSEMVAVTAGPNAGHTVTMAGTTDGAGMIKATFGTSATAGTDTVQAFVNKTPPMSKNKVGMEAMLRRAPRRSNRRSVSRLILTSTKSRCQRQSRGGPRLDAPGTSFEPAARSSFRL